MTSDLTIEENSRETSTTDSQAVASPMQWFVVQAYSGFEKHVQESLREYIRRAEMEDHFGDIEVPTEQVVELRNGQKRTSERKFFPGYVLVDRTHNVAGTSGTSSALSICALASGKSWYNSFIFSHTLFARSVRSFARSAGSVV